ncbi:MAG: CAP domain-containing protein [Spirochaetaceae bacterium]|nr:CAP domain-containing protein [Spirochaetaceae bacterium]
MKSTVSILCIFITLNLSLFSNEPDLISQINDYRISNGLDELIIEEKLMETALQYARVLAEEKRISHVDTEGGRVLDRYRAAGGTAVTAGEILGTSPETELIFEAWKESDSHRELILDPKWYRIGGALAKEGEQVIAVILFSNSQIDELFYKRLNNSVNVQIKTIGNIELSFGGFLPVDSVYMKNEDIQIYQVSIFRDQLPLLIPVSRNFNGIKKITDFLYIPDEILNETH